MRLHASRLNVDPQLLSLLCTVAGASGMYLMIVATVALAHTTQAYDACLQTLDGLNTTFFNQSMPGEPSTYCEDFTAHLQL